MNALTSLLSPDLLLFACAVTLVSGIVKGAVGFAMPLIMISGMGILLDPKLVVAGIILPIVLSNLLQVLRAGLGDAWTAIKDFAVYIVIVCVMILISAQFITVIPSDVMFLVLGIPVTVLCAIQLAGLRIVIAPQWRRTASLVAGFLSGTLGGLAGTWGPTTVLYLVALDTPKARQIVVQGVIYGLGSVMLLLGHLQSGVLNGRTVWFSALLLIPATLGMWVGFRIQDRIDQETFRKATLAVLLVAGLNLVRRGLMG
ncbi:sulfite exporter TauE/SafE family protein [Histidinibacterium aquaticum]|uniref:Probable membrane transporter protein n=1 Tax=Histidinibacterium aquaticum TaxID=2613962 RepID=A0A5J5GG76_9RHOB|nr:sulfite exporter TauE/SafE family protein [Histidinibacterium aquaticum]KAA9007087.1 sulfite exporter TauE/SafE family protein [Histidinibacterium aquaticum]